MGGFHGWEGAKRKSSKDGRLKTLSISRNGVSCDPDFHIWSLAVSSFPNSEDDAEQWLMLSKMERDRWLKYGENFEPSFLGNAASNRLIKRMGKMGIAGVVLHCYLFLLKKQITPSLEKASKLASEVGYVAERAYLSDSGIEKSVKLDADQTGVKKAFREYRSVSHILAARTVLPYQLDNMDVYDWSEKENLCLARLIFLFQERSKLLADYSAWNVVELSDFPQGFFGLDGTENLDKLKTLNKDIEEAYTTCFPA